jgi:hypothetical protein
LHYDYYYRLYVEAEDGTQAEYYLEVTISDEGGAAILSESAVEPELSGTLLETGDSQSGDDSQILQPEPQQTQEQQSQELVQ